MEIFKEIDNLKGYYISNYGHVKADEITVKWGTQNKTYPLRYLNPWKSRTGYNYVDISINGKINRFLLHRLVAIYFITNPENKFQVNHIDGNKNNNRVDNLEWCTAKHNLKHARDLGLNNSIGTNNKRAKLTESDIIEIRASKAPLAILSKKYNSHDSIISRIRSLKAYTNV